MKTAFFFVFSFLIVVAAYAKDHAGYAKKKNAVTREMKDAVLKYSETEDQYKILFREHAAFYLFPKKGGDKIKLVLDESMKTKKPLKITVDAFSREIISLTDNPN
ncbi:hypothetical protein D3C87_104340 [compost metagenome]